MLVGDFETALDVLESDEPVSEALYRLEDIRVEHGSSVYVEVMDAVRDEDYDLAREILDDAKDEGGGVNDA